MDRVKVGSLWFDRESAEYWLDKTGQYAIYLTQKGTWICRDQNDNHWVSSAKQAREYAEMHNIFVPELEYRPEDEI